MANKSCIYEGTVGSSRLKSEMLSLGLPTRTHTITMDGSITFTVIPSYLVPDKMGDTFQKLFSW